MNTQNLYRTYASFLKEKYGEKVYKIPLHIPADCPNRDGTLSTGGCDFCAESGTGFEMLSVKIPVKDQLQQNIEYIGKKYGADKFIAYFQNFSNTYLPFDQFEQAMMDAIHSKVVEIAVSTRPDCIEKKHLDLLHDIHHKQGVEISLELGLQTVNYHTLYAVNRGHGIAEFVDAVLHIQEYGFGICTHVILNLPGDQPMDIVETAKMISALKIQQVKIHALYLMKNTRMGIAYEKGLLDMISMDEYSERVVQFLEHLHPQIVVQRIIGRTPSEDSLFVNWNTSWWKIKEAICEKMTRENRYQGRLAGFLIDNKK